ncbi:MAG: VWA domain-containing protein, partial [Planctomycetota bacterium]
MNWPGFAALANAWWLLLLIPLIIFYFLKLRRPRVEIASLALWQSVVNDQRVNSPFQKFKRNILLWLQLALLTLLVLAAMQPFFVGGSGRSNYLPILVDCSASMAATDAETGKSRLAIAKERVREVVENLLPDQRVSLIAMHSTAQRLTEFTDNKRILLDALDQLAIRDVPSRLEDALRMTQALARTVPVDSVLVYSDGNFPQRVS